MSRRSDFFIQTAQRNAHLTDGMREVLQIALDLHMGITGCSDVNSEGNMEDDYMEDDYLALKQVMSNWDTAHKSSARFDCAVHNLLSAVTRDYEERAEKQKQYKKQQDERRAKLKTSLAILLDDVEGVEMLKAKGAELLKMKDEIFNGI